MGREIEVYLYPEKSEADREGYGILERNGRVKRDRYHDQYYVSYEEMGDMYYFFEDTDLIYKLECDPGSRIWELRFFSIEKKERRATAIFFKIEGRYNPWRLAAISTDYDQAIAAYERISDVVNQIDKHDYHIKYELKMENIKFAFKEISVTPDSILSIAYDEERKEVVGFIDNETFRRSQESMYVWNCQQETRYNVEKIDFRMLIKFFNGILEMLKLADSEAPLYKIPKNTGPSI